MLLAEHLTRGKGGATVRVRMQKEATASPTTGSATRWRSARATSSSTIPSSCSTPSRRSRRDPSMPGRRIPNLACGGTSSNESQTSTAHQAATHASDTESDRARYLRPERVMAWQRVCGGALDERSHLASAGPVLQRQSRRRCIICRASQPCPRPPLPRPLASSTSIAVMVSSGERYVEPHVMVRGCNFRYQRTSDARALALASQLSHDGGVI